MPDDDLSASAELPDPVWVRPFRQIVRRRIMKIAFLSPKGPLYRHRTGVFRRSLRLAPLTFPTLAALVPPEMDARIRIYDEGIEDIPQDIDADLIGITVITGNAPRAYELSDRLRGQGRTVVLGGPHVTLLPGEAAGHADSIVVGYAEETWPQLLRDLVAGQLRPRYDMSPDFSFDRLPKRPHPMRHLLAGKRYQTLNTFEATRGCSHSCDFCVVPTAWGRRPFLKPIEEVIDDIRQTGARRLVFYDLNLIANPTYAKELFRALIPLRVRWFGLATTLLARDPELLDLLARSGCRGLLIGFESVSSSSLEQVNKRFNRPADYAELVRTLHALGIAINGTFVFGSDADGVDSFGETAEFVIENRIDLPRFAILTPFPSTPLYEEMERTGRILTRDWSLYDGQHVVFQPAGMSVRELQEGHERIWREVYSVRSIWKRVRGLRPDLPILTAANFGYRFYAHNLSRFYTCGMGTVT